MDLRLWGHEDAIDSEKVRPRLVRIDDPEGADSVLWRWVFTGSPTIVSKGTRRRVRFLVVDDGHDGRLIGILGLSEFFDNNPTVDHWAGWDWQRRLAMSGALFGVRVLGVVAPYDRVAGSQLMLSLLRTVDLRKLVEERSGVAPFGYVIESSTAKASGLLTMVGDDLAEHVGDGEDVPLRLVGEAAEIVAAAASTRMSAPVVASDEGFTGLSRVARSGMSALGFGAEALIVPGSASSTFAVPHVQALRKVLAGERAPLWTQVSVDDAVTRWLRQAPGRLLPLPRRRVSAPLAA